MPRSLLWLLASILPAQAHAQVFDEPSVPASGTARAHLDVKAFGRYAITVQSDQGVSLQIVDRGAGPSEVSGRPGQEDGRIDRFLDRGTYRVLTQGAPEAAQGAPKAAQGEARLEAKLYRELEGPHSPSLLVEHRPIDASLGDVEQRSYWLDLPARRTVVLEAAGRNLTDLRLWKDGTWLVDASPTADRIEPKVGRPLRVQRLAADLEPGIYLVTAYGGPPLAWAEDDGTHPFHLRYGLRKHPSTLRQRFVIGPLGYDRFLVEGADYYRVELGEAQPISLEVRKYRAPNPFVAPRLAQAAITKKSVPPVAETRAREGPHLVTVRGPPGRAYVLQHFTQRRSLTLDAGAYYLSTVHAGAPEDSLDATGVLVAAAGRSPRRALEWQAVTVGNDRSWVRRFNLLGQATVFVEVSDKGRYGVVAKGDGKARVRVEPFFVTPPRDYRAPPFQGADSTWDLDPGLYMVTLRPERQGVVDVVMSRKGAFRRALQSLKGGANKPSRRLALRFPRHSVPEKGQTLYVSEQPGVSVGILARRLPLDLREALPLALGPSETLAVEARFSEAGLLTAEDEAGRRLEISVAGEPWTSAARPALGRHEVRVRSGDERSTMAVLRLAPDRSAADRPLPSLPEGRRAAVPKLPVLNEGARVPVDLDRDSGVSYLVRAEQPGLYRLESSGLLATQGVLRTRVVPKLADGDQNGVGRNFLVQQYLGAGDYQLTTRTRGRSRGHLGLRLSRTPAQDGGQLIDGIPARATLEAGQAVTYTFEVEEEGRYRLRARGRDRTFRARLEDAEGWPLERPGGPARFDRRFAPGTYRLVLLPESVRARAVTVLERERPPPAREGHGPHAIDLDEQVPHIWTGGDASARDVFRFEVPADIDVKIELGGKMQADVVRRGEGGTEKVAYVPPLRGWEGALPRGRYQLEVHPLRRDRGVPYSLAVRAVQLVVGRTWRVRAPVSLELALGAEERVEIASFGEADVEARLRDSEGRLVAQSDDRPDDWNFFIARRLSPGRYRLDLRPVGKRRARTEVKVSTRPEERAPALALGARKTFAAGNKKWVFPLEVGREELLVAWARSAETMGVALSRKKASSKEGSAPWITVAEHVGRPARVEVPVMEGGEYRLEVWSVDKRNSPVTLDVHGVQATSLTEAELARGVSTKPALSGVPISLLKVRLARPGAFRFEEEVRWSSSPLGALAPLRRGLAHASTDTLWIARPERRGKLTGRRVVLGDDRLSLSVGRSPIRVDLGGRGYALASARATQAVPGLALLEPSETPTARHYDVTEAGRATAVRFGGEGLAAHVFSASRGAEGFETSLSVRRFARADARPLEGSQRGILAAGEAVEFGLDEGLYRFRLAMDAGAVAAAGVDAVERVVVADGVVERFDARAQRVLLLNPTPAPIAYAVEAAPTSQLRTLPYEAVEGGQGRVELKVPPATGPRTLRVRGGRNVTFMGADGQVQRGADISVGRRGGVVRIRHGSGPLLAWLDAGAPLEGLFSASSARPRRVRPGLVSLEGREAVLELEADAPRLYSVRVGAPYVARWQAGGETPQITVASRGAELPLFLGGGTGQLRLRAVAGASLPDTLSVAEVSVPRLAEGVGPEFIVGPGQARAFRIVVPDERAIGVGLRASSAEVTAELRTSEGRLVGRGVAQMKTLAPGTYVLVVTSPADGPVARARLAVVGLDTPPTGPPPETLESYLSKAGYTEAP